MATQLESSLHISDLILQSEPCGSIGDANLSTRIRF